MVPDVLPPHRLLSTHSIPADSASSLLQTYILNSESHAHLHPDALIKHSKVVFSAHAGPTGGVVMHNVRRVAAGLRGEYLEPESTPEPEETATTAEGVAGSAAVGAMGANGKMARPKKSMKATGTKMTFDDEEGGASIEETANEGWMDKETYELEEGAVDEVGELGERSNFVQSGGVAPEVEATDEAGAGSKRKAKPDDKEARKKAKKEREKEFRKKREAEKKAKKTDE